MSAPTKATDNSQVKSPSGAESPTTVRPLEMDDDDVQDLGTLGNDASTASKQATVEDEAPAKPPRPLSPQQQAENTLKEAFPSIDAAVVKAVLMASGGRVEPAFNALLGMSDPDAVREPTPPPQPPRPTAPRAVGSTPQSQLESDEQYARQLAEHYGGGWSGERSSSRGDAPRRQQAGSNQSGYEPARERNFIDDDLPIIGENLKKGFLETQTKVNGWINTLKKRIDGEDDDAPRQNYNQGQSSNPQYHSRRSNDGRRSGDYNRYDADPQVLSDDFAGMQMNSDGTPARRSTRPLANPHLFKPTPPAPKSSDGRKVAFQGGPPEEFDIYSSSPRSGVKENNPPVSKQSKWQPLSTVDPSPIGEPENDPFSLGESEDEKESKDRVGGKEIRTDDADRLKKAAAEAMNDSISEPARKPEPAEIAGTKDKTAEEKLVGRP
ncbi:related to CUE5 Protein containing a CUE domain that binds ubiquitin, which may facilitate intramolecular monoubiquitination [Rhynchosporium secalis]|uniref:Related to CUE5 Protein containing a CUE domain that binds ubiquitin, which may facilitate intramolecular monoubiquitination n=1 Tax=Rhynchosporium secalis TaxID=38038 RepID=A0A1E1LUJ3_RHYSE|nr:related to CUE5 Protein containing a CUE domain that binds ubiquitin, which may facilitate intramolecular monoubiquitination [Rhynchosporium secalis]